MIQLCAELNLYQKKSPNNKQDIQNLPAFNITKIDLIFLLSDKAYFYSNIWYPSYSCHFYTQQIEHKQIDILTCNAFYNMNNFAMNDIKLETGF